jgi:hypothetical protein
MRMEFVVVMASEIYRPNTDTDTTHEGAAVSSVLSHNRKEGVQMCVVWGWYATHLRGQEAENFGLADDFLAQCSEASSTSR